MEDIDIGIQKAFGEMTEINDEQRIIWFRASSACIDRTGDIIEVSGWELDVADIKEIPFQPFHDYDKFPFGRLVGWKKTDALYIGVEFAPREISEDADIAYKMYKSGFMSKVSVGFKPVDYEKIVDEKGIISGWRYTKQILLELSAVTVPANPEASMIFAASLDKKAIEHMRKEYISMFEEVLTVERVKEAIGFMGITEIEEVAEICNEHIKAYDAEVKMKKIEDWQGIRAELKAYLTK